MSSRSQGRGARVAEFLDRPYVLLLVVPLGALYVGIVHLQHSRGFVQPHGVVGFVGVALLYLAQVLALLTDRRWARSGWAMVIIASSPFASLAYSLFLVGSVAPSMWAWLVAPVLMIAAYACRLRDLLVVGAFAYTAGFLFFVASGIDPRRDYGLVGILLVLWGVPAVLTRKVLGDLHQTQLDLQEQRGRDSISGALNRQGLDDHVAALRARLERQEPDARVSVIVVDLVGFKDLGALLGNTAAQDVLRRTADVLRRSYRRDHLVARPPGSSFVVVTTHDAASIADILVSDVQRAQAREDVSARAGAVRGIPLSSLSPEWLASVLTAAEELAESTPEHECTVVDHAGLRLVPGPAPAPPVAPLVPEAASAVGTVESSPELFGLGLSVVAVLVASIPPAPSSGQAHTLLVALGALVGMTGVFVGMRWLWGPVVHVLATVAALVAASLAVTTADGSYAAMVALVLVPFPVYLASLTLPVGTAAGLGFLLLPAVVHALFAGPFDRTTAMTAFTAVIGFGLMTAAMALWVRRQREIVTRRLFVATLVDPGTGLLSREGLVRRYRSLPSGEELAVLYVDIDDMARLNAEFGHHGGDTVLRRVAAQLVDAAGPTGAAGRVGGDEFVVLVPGPGRAGAVVRRITERLATDEIPVAVTIGQAFGRTAGDAVFWRLVAHADEALLLNRARQRVPGTSAASHARLAARAERSAAVGSPATDDPWQL